MIPPLADAALLAAGAPAGGVLDPKDESVTAAFLDLRGDTQEVALYKARQVGVALGPRLFLQEGLRLVVACGELPLQLAVAALGEKTSGNLNGDGPMIAVVKGEDLDDRLEELMLAGCEFRNATTGLPLRDDEWPHKAYTPAEPAIIAEALAAGARVVVARFVTPESVSDALAAADLGQLPERRSTGDVRFKFSKGYTLRVVLPADMNADWLEARLPVGSQVCRRHETIAGAQVLTIEADEDDTSIFEIAKRLTLSAPTGTLQHPLYAEIVWKFEESQFAVPSELLEFGYDLRAAKDWLDR